jgi:hypothetical protein
VRLLRSVGEASLCAQTEALPYRYVTVEGPVVIGEHDDAVQAALAYRYMGQEVGDLYLASIEGSVSNVVRLTPTRWRTVDYAKLTG